MDLEHPSSKPSERRLIENEVIFKSVNQNIKEFVSERTGSRIKFIKFYCECSDLDCTARIKLTTDRYEELHKNKKCFVTVVGHETPEIEKVIAKENSYQAVEKNFIPPRAEQIEKALKTIRI